MHEGLIKISNGESIEKKIINFKILKMYLQEIVSLCFEVAYYLFSNFCPILGIQFYPLVLKKDIQEIKQTI